MEMVGRMDNVRCWVMVWCVVGQLFLLVESPKTANVCHNQIAHE